MYGCREVDDEMEEWARRGRETLNRWYLREHVPGGTLAVWDEYNES